jgi:arginyl-tRNA synthetase
MRKHSGEVTERVDYSVLSTDEEFDLIKRLGELPAVVERAAEEYEPSVIAVYLLELTMSFNLFLARYRVLGEEQGITQARVLLTYGVKEVLAICLRILGMEVLERM